MNIFERIFSVRNDIDDVHKNITILGLKIKCKRWKYRKIKFSGKVQNWGVNIESDSIAILGNGPSLTQTLNDPNDYHFIVNKDICVVNALPIYEDFFKLKPKYLCFMDEAYWDTNPSQKVMKQINDICENLKKVYWELKIFMRIPAKQNNIFQKIVQNKHIKYIYICANDDIQLKNKEYLFNLYKEDRVSPILLNVLIGCIYMAINLGYKKIYLYGADHSWHLSMIVNEDNNVCFEDKYFYNNELTHKTSKNSLEISTQKISEIFKISAQLYKQYEMLEEYSQFMGATIYNFSKFSCIDAFRRKL